VARCDLLTVIGVPGVGKSRLVAEFVMTATGTVVRGRCPPYGEGLTYWPVLEAMRELRSTIDEVELPARPRAVLGDLLKGRGSAATDEIAWSVRTLLQTIGKIKPLLVIFDDLQWGEQTFLDLVEQLPPMVADVPVFVCCMGRPELLDRRPGWGPLLALEPLDEREASQLIGGQIAERRVNPGLRKRILAAAAGNPLFIEETAAMLTHAGDDEVMVPPIIQALMTARVDQLDPAQRALLQRGSIEGRCFTAVAWRR
jgi:predicted ATPase